MRIRFEPLAYDSLRVVIRDYLESFIIALVIAIGVRFFVLSAYQIPTSSMAPTLKAGDYILGFKPSYGWRLPLGLDWRRGRTGPARGEVVIFRYPQNEKINYVKRVIAIPGDHLEIRERRLIINGEPARYDRVETSWIDDLPGHEFYQAYRETWQQEERLVMLGQEFPVSQFGPVVVPPGHFFVLGDNRDSSEDSRTWGMVPEHLLEARAIMVWLSLDWQKRDAETGWPRIRWERMFTSL